MYHHSSDSSSSLPTSGCTNETDGSEIADVFFSGKAAEYGPTVVERWSLTDCVDTLFTRGIGGDDDIVFDQGCESVVYIPQHDT